MVQNTHLNIFNIFAAASNQSLIVSLLLNLSGDNEKDPGPVNNYTDVLKHVKHVNQLKFINLNCRSRKLESQTRKTKSFFKRFWA